MKRIVICGLVLVVGLSAAVVAVLWIASPKQGTTEGSQLIDIVNGAPVPSAKSEEVIQPAAFMRSDVLHQSAASDLTKTNWMDQSSEVANDALLDKVIQGVLDELSVAKSAGQSARILDLVRKLRSLGYGSKSSRFGSGSSAVALKLRVLDALSAVGPAGAIEAVSLIGDSEPVISQRATDVLFEGLQDYTMGDRDRSEIIVVASEEMEDANNLMRLYQEFVRVRHSVGTEALMAISQSGTAAAKEQLPRVISTFTGDLSITDVSQLDAWLKENPDSERDEWFYGPKTFQGN